MSSISGEGLYHRWWVIVQTGFVLHTEYFPSCICIEHVRHGMDAMQRLEFKKVLAGTDSFEHASYKVINSPCVIKTT